MAFISSMFEQAKAKKKRIVLPESYDPRVIEAAARALEKGIAEIILVGDKEKIAGVAPEFDISGAEIIDPCNYAEFDRFVDELVKLRAHKGMTVEKAQIALKEPPTFGVMLVKMGIADGLVSGSVGSTADTLRPALQILRTKPGIRLVSSFFMMVVQDRAFGADGVLLFSDCALNENPDAEQLSDIAISSAASFEALTGEKAKVALLSYSTHGSAKSEMTNKVVEATRLAKEKAPELTLDGELQADTALVASVAKKKAPQSQIQGDANCLIFPDLNAANIGAKLTERLGGAKAYGPMLQGIAKPVNDLSRGCTADDIVGVIAITVVQAQSEENS